MKQSESRRSFIFGVGAFAAAIWLPKAPKLFFPVTDNPIALAGGPTVGTNRTGNRECYVWLVQGKDGMKKFMEKFGAPPRHAFDGRPVPGIANEPARRRFENGWFLKTTELGQGSWDSGPRALGDNWTVNMLTKESTEHFLHRAHAIEKTLQDGDGG